MDIKLIARWDDLSGEGNEKYMTFELDDYGMCDVKVKEDGYMYIMYSGNGYEVYRDADDGYRDCTEDEKETVYNLAEEQLEVEMMMDCR
jgi:hypothetical protein